MRKFLLVIFTFLAFVMYNFRASAQGVTTASINGVVSDNKGPIPGATITATHVPTGTVYTAASRSNGRYNIPNLRVGGPYTVKVSFIGYTTYQIDNITLNIGQDQKIDVLLKENNVALQEVKITGTGSKVINSSRTGARETVTRSQIENLPTVNRSLSDFTSLTPSANGLNFGGRSSTFNNLTVDGALFNNSFGLSSTLGGQTSSQPISLDAIDQIQVDIAPYDVRQGNFTGAGINTVVKSGTNTFKGTVYDFIRGTGLTGYQAGDVTVTKVPFTYRSTGVALGGPIIKNKLFLFVSGEEERIQRPANSYSATGSGSNGQVSSVPSSTLDNISNTLKNQYGYDPGPYQNFNFNTFSNKATVKLDWNIDKNNVLSAKYFYLKSYADQPPSNSGITNGGVGYGTTRAAGPNTLPFYGAGYRINNNFNIGIIELDSKLSNTVSNKLTVGYSALRDYRQFLGGGTSIPMVDIGNGVTSSTGAIITAPTAIATSFGSELYTAGNLLNTNITQFSDDLTIFKGAHEITFGTNNQIQSYVNGFAPDYNGLYTYASASDFLNGLPAQAYTYRNSALADGSFPFAKIKAAILSLYAQDKWHATDNLRVTYGLRADYDIFPTSLAQNPNATALTFQGGYAGGIHVDPSKLPENRVLLSPRLGFNWDIFGDGSTQLRGGTGIFTGLVPFVWISNQASNNGLLFGSGTVTKTATPNDPRLIFNPNVNANRPASTAANTSYELDITDPKLKYPQIFRTNLAVDQRLPWGIIGTIEGAYTKDINAIYHQNLVLSNSYTVLPGPEGQIRYTSSNITPLNGNTLSAANPKITGLYYMTNTNKGYSYFVTAQLQKSFSNGLYANVAYTHSGSKDVNDGGSTASTIWSTRYIAGDPNANVASNSTYVMPNRVIATAYYKLKEGKYGTTTVGFKFEMANSGAISYITSGDPNNDGQTTNDLMWIPKQQSDIILVKSSAADTRTPDQIWQQLNGFISQDKYLNSHRGQYAERNGVILPYFKRLDFHAAQDIYIQTGKVKNTLQVTFDVINFTNLLNHNWGLYQNSYSGFSNGATTVLKYMGTDATTGRPTYSLPLTTINGVANTVPTQSFINDFSAGSRWYAQIGLRYIFN